MITKPLCVQAPAKINLFLHVTGRRPDGFHELVSLMCPVALYDTLTLTPANQDIHVICGHPDVPEDASNLAARAARLFMEAAISESFPSVSGLTIHIDKKIPVGAGLGGGSSDAAAVLTALNCHRARPLSTPALMELAGRLGADVPFFIPGGAALASGIGDRLEPFPHLASWTALLVYPNVAVSTAWVYKNLNLRLTKDEKKLSNFHFDGRFFNIDKHLVNDLEAVTQTVLPVVGEIKRLLLANGAAGAMMTGSGSTVFGLFTNAERATLSQEALCCSPQSQDWTLFMADLLV